MQKTSMKRMLACLLAAVVSASALASCNSGNTTSSSSAESGSSSQAESSSSTDSDTGVPLVVAYDTFNQKFNPFYYTVAYDGDVASICVDSLLSNDRSGEMVLKGVEGETAITTALIIPTMALLTVPSTRVRIPRPIPSSFVKALNSPTARN